MNYNLSMLPYILMVFCASSLLYYLLLILYRLFFHPLRQFPGPKLAAATILYRAWFQIVHDGGQLRQWNKLHARYGPIVRIAPNQLHFSSPDAYDEITNFASVFTKDEDFWYFTGQTDAMLGVANEARHKQLFRPVASLFGPRGAQASEETAWKNTMRFCELLNNAAEKPVNMALGLRALMLDNVLEFVFGDVPSTIQSLVDTSFSSPYLVSSYLWMDWLGTWPRRNFPRLFPLIVSMMPDCVYQALLPGDRAMTQFYEVTRKSIENRLEAPKWVRDCFFSRFSSDCSLDYLALEGVAVILGGIVDSSNILQYGLFRICADTILQEQLHAEVDSVWSEMSSELPNISALQNLSLLTGVVMESIRLTHGVISGSPRTAPAGGATLVGASIPGGTSVTTSSIYPHLNPAVFHDPNAFIPSRWLNATPEMNKSISAFSKGRRQCPARQIATNQLYITFAALLHNFNFEAYETSIEDFELKAYLSAHFAGREFQAISYPRQKC